MSRNVTGQVQAATTPDRERIISDFASFQRDFTDLVDHVKGGAVATAASGQNFVSRQNCRRHIPMTDNSCSFLKVNVRAAAVLAGLVVASCAPLYSSPEQVQASNPSVTYKYRSDNELVQANQSAVTFCDRYQSVPRTVNIANDPDGSRVVVFECVPTSQAATPLPQSNPNLTYNYRTDQELLDASRNAQIYCANTGSQKMTSNIVANANGTKTVTFECSSW